MSEDIIYDGTIKHNELGIGGKLGIWLTDRTKNSWISKFLNKITPKIFHFGTPYINIPADNDEAGDWLVGQHVQVIIRKPTVGDLDKKGEEN